MNAVGVALNLKPDVLDEMMSAPPPIQVQNPTPIPTALGTAVQKVLNVALHYPQAAAKAAEGSDMSVLNQPGADVLRRVFGLAARLTEANSAQLLENMHDDPHFEALRRVGARPLMGIDDEETALLVLKDSLAIMATDARQAAEVERTRTHKLSSPTDSKGVIED